MAHAIVTRNRRLLFTRLHLTQFTNCSTTNSCLSATAQHTTVHQLLKNIDSTASKALPLQRLDGRYVSDFTCWTFLLKATPVTRQRLYVCSVAVSSQTLVITSLSSNAACFLHPSGMQMVIIPLTPARTTLDPPLAIGCIQLAVSLVSLASATRRFSVHR